MHVHIVLQEWHYPLIIICISFQATTNNTSTGYRSRHNSEWKFSIYPHKCKLSTKEHGKVWRQTRHKFHLFNVDLIGWEWGEARHISMPFFRVICDLQCGDEKSTGSDATFLCLEILYSRLKFNMSFFIIPNDVRTVCPSFVFDHDGIFHLLVVYICRSF